MVRVKDLSHNMQPVMLNISVKFHKDIPYSKGPLSQYVTFDVNYICKVSFRNSI